MELIPNSKATREDMHQNIPFVEFIDIDRDSMIDMIFYHDGKIHTYYNMHTPKPIPDNPYEEAKLCKLAEDLEEEEGLAFFTDRKKLTEEEIASGGNQWVSFLDLHDIIDVGDFDLVNPDHDQGKHYFPGRIRFADMNIDGFPDMLISLEFNELGPDGFQPLPSIMKKKSSYVFINTECIDLTLPTVE